MTARKMVEQQRDVFSPIAQSGQAARWRLQAVIKILPKLALPGGL
jgi:hypothetical protein